MEHIRSLSRQKYGPMKWHKICEQLMTRILNLNWDAKPLVAAIYRFVRISIQPVCGGISSFISRMLRAYGPSPIRFQRNNFAFPNHFKLFVESFTDAVIEKKIRDLLNLPTAKWNAVMVSGTQIRRTTLKFEKKDKDLSSSVFHLNWHLGNWMSCEVQRWGCSKRNDRARIMYLKSDALAYTCYLTWSRLRFLVIDSDFCLLQ